MHRPEGIFDNPDEGVAEHIREYVATDGRRGQWLTGWKAPTLLLVTRGRRSGKLRRTALAYGEDDGRYVLVASNGGAKRHPDWYLNLVGNPSVQVQVGDARFTARARDARADERPALWKLMTSIGPELEDHQRNSGGDPGRDPGTNLGPGGQPRQRRIPAVSRRRPATRAPLSSAERRVGADPTCLIERNRALMATTWNGWSV